MAHQAAVEDGTMAVMYTVGYLSLQSLIYSPLLLFPVTFTAKEGPTGPTDGGDQ